jgi:hypothetical protein
MPTFQLGKLLFRMRHLPEGGARSKFENATAQFLCTNAKPLTGFLIAGKIGGSFALSWCCLCLCVLPNVEPFLDECVNKGSMFT